MGRVLIKDLLKLQCIKISIFLEFVKLFILCVYSINVLIKEITYNFHLILLLELKFESFAFYMEDFETMC